MIKLVKGPEPEVLKNNSSKWTKELLDHVAVGTAPSDRDLNRYNHPEVKSALKEETANKCAYCESFFTHVYFGDIEHIVPKRVGVEFRFKWENLTVACAICNNGKSDRENIIDPYTDNVCDAFFYLGPVMLPFPDNDKAVITEIALELNRAALTERRRDRILALNKIICCAKQNRSPEIEEAILEDFRLNELSSKKEFSAMSAAYYKHIRDLGII